MAALAALGLLLVLAFAVDPQTRPGNLATDFNAFYCAGAALDRGADPYRAEPLGSCERAPRPAWLARAQPGLAIPAPLPPYALTCFALLARVPYTPAVIMWWALLLAAAVATAAALRRATDLPWAAIVAALALGDGMVGVALGQVAPIAVAAVTIAMWLLETGAEGAAGWFASLAMIEPHIGLPSCLALFLWKPRARVPLVAAGAVFALLSLPYGGVALWREYFGDVLPAHAASEIINVKQFSLTYALQRLGVDGMTSLQIGNVSYAVMSALGILLAPRLARKLAAPGMIVALPAAFAVMGGPFVHIVQIVIALPAALLLYARTDANRRALSWAIAALAVPFVQFTTLGTAFPLLAAVACFVLLAAFERPLLEAATAGAAAFGLLAASWASIVTRIPSPTATLLAHYDPNALAQQSWAWYVRLVGTTDPLAFDLAKLPTWIALAALAWIATQTALGVRAGVRTLARNGNAAAGRIA